MGGESRGETRLRGGSLGEATEPRWGIERRRRERRSTCALRAAVPFELRDFVRGQGSTSGAYGGAVFTVADDLVCDERDADNGDHGDRCRGGHMYRGWKRCDQRERGDWAAASESAADA